MTDLPTAERRAELLPCPFCGSAAIFRRSKERQNNPNFGAEWIECSNRACGTSTQLRFPCMEDVKPLLAETWNRLAT